MNNQPHKNRPDEVYREEMQGEGSTFADSPLESAARDAAKIDKAAAGYGQKMDGNNPFADEDTVSNEDINKEKYDDHK